MTWSRWIGLALMVLFALGCNRGAPQTAVTTQNPQGSSVEPHSGHHMVVRPVDPKTTVAEQTQPQSAPPRPIDEQAMSVLAAPLAADPAITPIPSLVEEAFNPLRGDTRMEPAPPPEPAIENPLRLLDTARAFSAVPRMAHSHRAAPPRAAASLPPAAAGDGPAAAADPPREAPPAASAPPGAGGSGAPEFSGTAAPTDVVPPTSAAPPALAGLAGLTPPAGATPPAAYDVVPVFYATDRLALDASAENFPQQLARFLPTAISLLITLALGLVAQGKRRPAVWLLVCVGIVFSSALGYQATSGALVTLRRAGHVGPQYTSDRSAAGEVQLGMCETTIPKTHQVGELEAPSILRLEVRPDANKHVILTKTERLADERFYELLRSRVAASPKKELFVFVHGFNVTFEDAARRTAQIQHDLQYEGAPVFYSWPAHDKFILTYKADEANVSWSAAHLKRFLLDVTRESRAQSINLIAHSMGNRALTASLKELQLELRDQSRLFNQVILAAPDIDADEFRESIAPAMTRTANRFTLYASARDEALAASQLVHHGPRAGDAGRGLVVVPGIDTIDVTQIDTSPFGHTYYGSSDPVLRDLGLILSRAVPPEQRVWLAAAELNGLPYWVFQPVNAATARMPGATIPDPVVR
jgi:esterase/lipase superfamily enzyme